MASSDDLPPAPDARRISPAPEDYVTRPGPGAYLWPLVFFGLFAALIVAVVATGWHDVAAH